MSEARQLFGNYMQLPRLEQHDTSNGRFYKLGKKSYTSVTTVLESLPRKALTKYNLRKWFAAARKHAEIERDLNITEFIDHWIWKVNHDDDPDTSAADFGTAVHELAERYVISGETECHPRYQRCFDGFREWYSQIEDEWMYEPEVQFHSNVYGFAGTADIVMKARNADIYLIGDIKTSKDVWPAYDYQLSAYAEAFNEHFGTMPQTFVLHIKESGRWEDLMIPAEDQQDAWNIFKSVTLIQELTKYYEQNFNRRKYQNG